MGATVYEKNNGAWWHKATNRVFLVNGSNASTITGITREKLTGLEPGVISETHVADSHGNITVRRTSVNRAAAKVIRTVDYPDSDIDAKSTSTNGYVMSETDRAGLTVTYDYDSLGRLARTENPATGTVITHYSQSGRVSHVSKTYADGKSTIYSHISGAGFIPGMGT